MPEPSSAQSSITLSGGQKLWFDHIDRGRRDIWGFGNSLQFPLHDLEGDCDTTGVHKARPWILKEFSWFFMMTEVFYVFWSGKCVVWFRDCDLEILLGCACG